ALGVDAAVAAALAARLRLVGNAELGVDLERAGELFLRDDVAAAGHLHGAAVDQLPVSRRLAVPLGPAVERLAVEEDDRAGRRRHRRLVLGVFGLGELDVIDGAIGIFLGGRGRRDEQG